MTNDKPSVPPALTAWFSSGPARNGGVIRMARKDVDAKMGGNLRHVTAEARRRGWHVVENGSQVIVFCNDGGLTIHC